jgi:hypothetical protein
MKIPEDEAFDDLAKRQGAWGGGFPAKRAMAADKFIAAEERKVGERYGYVPKLHPSEWMNDHNEDNLDMVAQPAQEPPSEWAGIKAILDEYGLQAIDFVADFKAALAQPAQEPVAHVYLFDHEGRPRIAWDNAKGVQIGDKLYTAPPQRPWIWLSDADIADVIDTTCQYTGSYEEFLIKKAERKIRSMNT